MPLHVAPLPAALTTSTSPSSSPSTSPITKRCSTPAIDSDYEWDDADVAFEKQYEIRCQTKNDVRVNININISQRQWEHHDEIIHLIDIDEDDTLEHELDEEMDDIDVDYESTRKFRLMHDGIYDRHIHRERWSKTFHEPYISREMAHHQLQHGSSHYVYSQKHIAAMRIKHEATTYHHRRTQRQRRQQVQDDVVQSQTRPMPRIVKDDHGVPIMNSPFEKRPRKNREADRLRYKQQMETIIQLQKTWDEEQVEIGVTPPQKPMNSNNVNKIPVATRWDCVLQQRHAKQQARRTAQASRPILPPSHSSAIASHPKRSRPRRTPGKKSQPVTTSRFVPLVPASAVPALAPTTTKKHVPLPSSWHHNTAKQDFTSFRRHFYDYHHDKIHESLKNGPYGVALRCVPIGEQAQEKFMSAYRQHPQIPALTYHGTSIQHMQSICDHGLLMPHEHRKGIANGSAYGVGIYTATQANISVGYCRSISTMFICAVLDKPAQREHVVTPSSFVVLFNSSLVIPLFLLDFVYDLDPKEITPFTTSTSSIPRWSVRFAPSPLEIHLDNPPKPHHREKSILSNWATRVRQAEIGRHHHIRYDAITWE